MSRRTRLRKPRPARNRQDETAPVVQAALDASGKPLDAATRTTLEPRFGHDFSQVRVHTDDQAAESAQALEAQAYTTGQDIVFGAGRYAPETPEGRQLLAHELTHVVQQADSPAPTTSEITLGDPAGQHEQAANQAAARVAYGQAADQSPASAPATGGGMLVQRKPVDADTEESDTPAEPIVVEHEVELVPQPSETTGWAAAMAMLANFRDNEEYGIDDIATRAQMDAVTPYDWIDIQKGAAPWELYSKEVEELFPEKQESSSEPQPASPSDWSKLLETYGPILVLDKGDPSRTIVLARMHGDGTPEGTEVTLYDPMPQNSGRVEQKTFAEFDQEFELGAKIETAIVHAEI
jgi:hypothetical protein